MIGKIRKHKAFEEYVRYGQRNECRCGQEQYKTATQQVYKVGGVGTQHLSDADLFESCLRGEHHHAEQSHRCDGNGKDRKKADDLDHGRKFTVGFFNFLVIKLGVKQMYPIDLLPYSLDLGHGGRHVGALDFRINDRSVTRRPEHKSSRLDEVIDLAIVKIFHDAHNGHLATLVAEVAERDFFSD